MEFSLLHLNIVNAKLMLSNPISKKTPHEGPNCHTTIFLVDSKVLFLTPKQTNTLLRTHTHTPTQPHHKTLQPPLLNH